MRSILVSLVLTALAACAAPSPQRPALSPEAREHFEQRRRELQAQTRSNPPIAPLGTDGHATIARLRNGGWYTLFNTVLGDSYWARLKHVDDPKVLDLFISATTGRIEVSVLAPAELYDLPH